MAGDRNKAMVADKDNISYTIMSVRHRLFHHLVMLLTLERPNLIRS